jgi:hypothetical protein
MGKTVGGFMKRNAGAIGTGLGAIGGAFVGNPMLGAKIGGAVGGAVQGGSNAMGLGRFDAKQAPVDPKAFQESERSTQFYNDLQSRLGQTNQQAPTVTGQQLAPNERATVERSAGPTQWNAAQLDPKSLGLTNTARTATAAGPSTFEGVDLNQLQRNQAQGAAATAASATAAEIDQARSDEIRARQMGFTDRLIAEEGGIASDALTRSLRQTTDRGLAAQAALMNSGRGNAGLNQRTAANAMARVSQQGAQTALDAFAAERAAARGALSQNMAATRGVDADLAAQQAGFENAAALENAQLATQASIATAQNQTQAGMSNADAFARALMQNSQLGTQNNQFNVGQSNEMSRFNTGQQNQFGIQQNDILTRIGLANTGAQNDALSQFQNLNQQSNIFNAGQANQLNQFNAGQQNQMNQNQAQLNQQANLANQSAAMQQAGLNQSQIQFLLGLQQQQNQFGANQGMTLQQLMSNNFNAAQGINATQFMNQQQRQGDFIGKLGQGLGALATQFTGGGGRMPQLPAFNNALANTLNMMPPQMPQPITSVNPALVNTRSLI